MYFVNNILQYVFKKCGKAVRKIINGKKSSITENEVNIC